MDLARWRSLDVSRRTLNYLHQYRDRISFWDQDALNAVLAEDWAEIARKWNWQPSVGHLVRKVTDESPSIVHFSGNLKHWNFAGRGWHHDR